ncbi:PREDICTED: uncharacterized protein LOC108564067 [Nicrophorus vespilloides]|uniref:Uncharacterized protein LOC108564067 n=1 Tax=Nicrophorus vespilloides TaxID=110193 RepID=A0ABM1MV61_NICVS|nr:PREDICTED: uncharacterized protein LOC108564067 [Nicrophorus vespilloides]
MCGRLLLMPLLLGLWGSGEAGVLLWGPQEMLLPTLSRFDDHQLEDLLQKLDKPKVVAFRGDHTLLLGDDLRVLLQDEHTAYVPNVDIDVEDLIVLDGDVESDLSVIRGKLDEHRDENVLAVLMDGRSRVKREEQQEGEGGAGYEETENPVDQQMAQQEEEEEERAEEVEQLGRREGGAETPASTTAAPAAAEPPTKYEEHVGPVLYNANGNAMVFLAKAPSLKVNNTLMSLGKATLVTVDNRTKFSKLSVTIPIADGGKVTLRFKFMWTVGYWSLDLIELEMDAQTYTLTTSRDIVSARNFSYHCSGPMIFMNTENSIKLSLYSLQLQPNTKKGRFDDAYDCVSFTTAPIWSGIFVSSIMLVVLALALTALNNIKTMDKFDNSKTKQLSITVSE